MKIANRNYQRNCWKLKLKKFKSWNKLLVIDLAFLIFCKNIKRVENESCIIFISRGVAHWICRAHIYTITVPKTVSRIFLHFYCNVRYIMHLYNKCKFAGSFFFSCTSCKRELGYRCTEREKERWKNGGWARAREREKEINTDIYINVRHTTF